MKKYRLIFQLLWLPMLALSPAIHAYELIHPICMERLLGSLEEPSNASDPISIDLKECQKKYQSYPYKKLNPFSAEFRRPLQDNNNSIPAFVRYAIVGELANQQFLVNISTSYGGSMTQSSGLVVKGLQTPPPGKNKHLLTRTHEILGGDRCFGAVKSLSILAPDQIEIRRKITTTDLLSLNRKDSKPIDGTASCAVCCIGEITERQTIGHPAHLSHVEINQLLSANDYAYRQGCFNKLTGNVSSQRPLRLNKKQLGEFQKAFVSRCIQPEMKKSDPPPQ